VTAQKGEVIFYVDASYDQLGCCLLPQQPDNKSLSVGYFSKGLLPAEKNYAVTGIQGLGVVWAVGLLRRYIEGTKVLIRCDHKALKWIFSTTACTNNRLNRWRILLSEYDYDVEYMPGPQHVVADALSRIPTEGLDTRPIVGRRAHLHLDVIFCIAPHLERCTRHRDGSRRAPRNTYLHLVVIF